MCGPTDRAYEEALSQQPTPARRAELAKAQRLWTEYRDGNCAFYGSGPGSIAAVEAAECRRVLTRRRARELEQIAGKEPN